MKETRSLQITKKQFSINNMRFIANILYDEYKNAKRQDRHCSITYLIKCNDDTSYESDSLNIFEEGEIVSIKKAEMIEFTFHDYRLERYVFFSVSEGNGRSFVKVQGNDGKWVKNLFIKLKEYIDSVNGQENPLLKYKEIIRHILALGLGKIILFVMVGILSFFFGTEGNSNPSEGVIRLRELIQKNIILAQFFVNWLIPWLYGLSIAKDIIREINKLWPNVEFDFGPEQERYYKISRDRLKRILTLVIIPSVLMIVYDLIKTIL